MEGQTAKLCQGSGVATSSFEPQFPGLHGKEDEPLIKLQGSGGWTRPS